LIGSSKQGGARIFMRVCKFWDLSDDRP